MMREAVRVDWVCVALFSRKKRLYGVETGVTNSFAETEGYIFGGRGKSNANCSEHLED